MKELVYTPLSRRIVYVSTNGKGRITGDKRIDLTENAIWCVYQFIKDLAKDDQAITFKDEDGIVNRIILENVTDKEVL